MRNVLNKNLDVTNYCQHGAGIYPPSPFEQYQIESGLDESS
jgi:hypothetical protein